MLSIYLLLLYSDDDDDESLESEKLRFPRFA
jgi:hypothetical protein